MNKHIQRVANNILPLSIADNLLDAFKEWYCTDLVKDYEDIVETCQLCNQEELRYHFEIKNRYTNNVLLVGSSCILRFQVTVYDENFRILDNASSKKKLEKLKEKIRLEKCIKSLEELAEQENNDILTNALEYYKKNKYLTPKFAFVVFWRLQEHKIDYNKLFFKISLKRKKYKEDIANMQLGQFALVFSALTSNQKILVQKLRHENNKPY